MVYFSYEEGYIQEHFSDSFQEIRPRVHRVGKDLGFFFRLGVILTSFKRVLRHGPLVCLGFFQGYIRGSYDEATLRPIKSPKPY